MPETVAGLQDRRRSCREGTDAAMARRRVIVSAAMTSARYCQAALVSLLLFGAQVSHAGGLAAPASPTRSVPQNENINGMTVSTSRGSAEWGKDAIVGTIAELKQLGVNWTSIHPYARIGRDGSVSWRRGEGDAATAPTWLRRPIEEAHRQGLKIFIKPHLGYWGSFSWRGEIAFSSDVEWHRFFDDYRRWITAVARFSHDADAFAVGTELDKTVDHEAAWRDVIRAVRAEYAGPLTYAANWTDYERIPFWDALDAIGVQAYFPVLEDAGGAADLPPQQAFDAGWSRIMQRMRTFSERYGKTVVFTELGYNRSARAPYEPWAFEVGGPNADELQRRCMLAALQALEAEPSVVGAFLWKWFPGDARPRDFEMSSAAMRQVISRYWNADS